MLLANISVAQVRYISNVPHPSVCSFGAHASNGLCKNADVMFTLLQAILAAYPACALLRRHPTPPPRQFEPLLAAASAAGFTLDVSTSRVQPCWSSIITVMASCRRLFGAVCSRPSRYRCSWCTAGARAVTR